jgi:hypothetical protein
MRSRMNEESNQTIPVESRGSPSPTTPNEGQVGQDQDDAVMQEAIRRSLVDVAAKKEPEGVEPKESTTESQALSAETVAIPPCDEEEYVIEAVKVETVEEGSIAEFEPSSPSKEKETSFASEAAGSGEIAEFVGETLDRMSEAIDSLNSQLAVGNHDDDSADCDDDDDQKAGSKIVDGEEDANSEASWSVVVTEFQDGDADREIARAAEAIGSALFNSDVLRSSENFSAMSAHSMGESAGSSSSGSSSSSSSSSSDDEQFSSVTSVPTTIHSMAPGSDHLSEYQLNRWAVQLEQLHEMGFTNDALCVEVIESLAAANIGVDSQDEVSVQQVVDKLMNGW